MGGCLPIVFASLLLRIGGKKSAYTLISTTCCICLSASVWFYTYYGVSEPNNVTYDGAALPACGGMVAPIKYCYDSDWFANNADATTKGIAMVLFCLVVQTCLIIDQCEFFTIENAHGEEKHKVDIFTKIRHTILRSNFWHKYERKAIQSPWLGKLHLDTRERVLKVMQGFILLGTEMACAGLNIVLIVGKQRQAQRAGCSLEERLTMTLPQLIDYAHILTSSYNSTVNLDLNEWSLGQVISVRFQAHAIS